MLFTNSSSSSGLQVAAEDAWEHLAEDEDKSTIMAKVGRHAAVVDATAVHLETRPSSNTVQAP